MPYCATPRMRKCSQCGKHFEIDCGYGFAAVGELNRNVDACPECRGKPFVVYPNDVEGRFDWEPLEYLVELGHPQIYEKDDFCDEWDECPD